MFRKARVRAPAIVASALSMFAVTSWAEPVVITVPGQTVTHTIPGVATPPIGPITVGTPPITVPRTCAGAIFCAGPIEIPPQTIVNVPQIDPVAVTPAITLTASTTDIVAVADPAVTSLVTVPPTIVIVPNPFGGDPIPVEVCPSSCSVPGASVLDGANGSVALTACVGSTCETQTVPVQFGDTSPGEICFTRATDSLQEGTGGTRSLTLYVERRNGTFDDAYVRYSTQDGTAVAPGDYAYASDWVYWPHGEGGQKPVTLTVVSDSEDEPNENFSVALSDVQGATLCQPSVATVTIQDDDLPSAGSLRFAMGSYSVNEDGVSVNIEVQRVEGTYGTAEADVVFSNLTTSTDDYFVTNSPTRVTFNDGDATSRFVTVFINDDSVVEPNEQFQAELTIVSGGASLGNPSTTTVTIFDNDVPPPSDGEPDQFLFIDRSTVARNVMVYSNVVTITGINIPVDVSVWGGEWSLRTSAVCDGTGTWYPQGNASGPQITDGALVCVRHMSASTFSTSVSTTLTVGNPGKSDTFTSTTRDQIGDECNPGQICP